MFEIEFPTDQLRAFSIVVQNLHEDMDKLAPYFLAKIGKRIVATSRSYLKGTKEPYMVMWDEHKDYTYDFYPEDRVMGSTDYGRANHLRVNKETDTILYDTGRLYDAIEIQSIAGDELTVGVDVKYAALHEYGGQVMFGNSLLTIPARPYLRPAVYEVMDDEHFKDLIKKEVHTIIKHALKTGKLKVPYMNW